MADRDLVEPSEWERLLRQELSIEPSSAFAPRVRQRVAAEPQRSAWRPWTFALAGVGAAAGVLAVLLPLTTGTVVPPGAEPVKPTEVPVSTTARVPLLAATERLEPPPARRKPAAHAERVEPAPSDLPVVIVDERQRAALRTLFRLIEQGQVSGNAFERTVPVSLEPVADQVTAITVQPVVVNAILPGGVLHDDRER